MRHVSKPTESAVTYLCPCCHFRTLQGRGGFEICSICFWEDDGQDDESADEVWGGPNGDLHSRKRGRTTPAMALPMRATSRTSLLRPIPSGTTG